MNEILETLRTHVLARGFSDDDVHYLAELAQVVCYMQDAIVFHESQPRRKCGILLSGLLEIRKGLRGQTHVIARLAAGECYGEGALLDDYPHGTTGVVLESAEAIEFSLEHLARILQERPLAYARMTAGAAQI